MDAGSGGPPSDDDDTLDEPAAGPGGGQYFARRPDSVPRLRTMPVRLRGWPVTVTTAAGVFSADRLDPGTEVLLRTVPAPPSHGNLLDLGCGWGPLALSLALAAPDATVWAVDVNERARELAVTNASRLGLRRVRVVAPEELPADLSFDALWSNPPVRVGKQALHELLLQWLPRLSLGASAWLVVQRNLGADSLHRWLDHTLAGRLRVERAASSKGYRVLRVSRPPV